MNANALESASRTREVRDQNLPQGASPVPRIGHHAAECSRSLPDVVWAIEQAMRFLALEGTARPGLENFSGSLAAGLRADAAPPDSTWLPVSRGHSRMPAENRGGSDHTAAQCGTRGRRRVNRVLVTLLFTDIVESTRLAETLGDEKWHRLLERHRSIVRRQIARFGGCEMEVLGDGFLTTFDSPTNAVKCARAIRAALRLIGLEIRAGLHAGECGITSGRLVGIAVHIAARVVRIAAAGQILVSSTVRDLAFGSGLCFSAEIAYALKGLTENWRLFELHEDLLGQDSGKTLTPSPEHSPSRNRDRTAAVPHSANTTLCDRGGQVFQGCFATAPPKLGFTKKSGRAED